MAKNKNEVLDDKLNGSKGIMLNKQGGGRKNSTPSKRKTVASRIANMKSYLLDAGVAKTEANEIVRQVLHNGTVPKSFRPQLGKEGRALYQANTARKVNDAQVALKNRPKTKRTLKTMQNDTLALLRESILDPSNPIADEMMSKLNITLASYSQALKNTLNMDNISLADSDRSDILTDLAIIDGAITSGSSAEQLKAVSVAFKTISRFLSVSATPTFDSKMFENVSELLSYGSIEASQSSVLGGSPKDARVEPDFTFKTTLHLLPITDKLKAKLVSMGVSAAVIAELGNYTPGASHDGSADKKGIANATDTFSWPTQVPTDYLGPKVYDEVVEDFITFVRETSQLLISKQTTLGYFAESAHTNAVSPADIAVKLYIYLAMNTAWKLLIEQALDVPEVIISRMNLELSRFKAIAPNDLANIFILSNRNIMQYDQERNDQIVKRIDIAYNKKLYDLMKPAFREHIYTFTSPNVSYYLGDKKVGDHIFTVKVIPNLSVPAPITGLTLVDDGTAAPTVTGSDLYTSVFVENGTFDDRTKVLKDLEVDFTNGLALHTMYLNATKFAAITTDSRFNIDKEPYFTTLATSYGALRDTMAYTDLGNKGVQVSMSPTGIADLYPDGDLGDSAEIGVKIMAHLSDHCSQWSFLLFKSFSRFVREKFSSYRQMKKFIDLSLGMTSHPAIGYTENWQGRVAKDSKLSKSLDYKSAFSLVPLYSSTNITYIHSDPSSYPVYIGQDNGSTVIKIANIQGQKNVRRDSIEKLVRKKIDHVPYQDHADIKLREDSLTGMLGYEIGTVTVNEKPMFTNGRILELYSPRCTFFNETHYATVPVLANDNTVKGIALKDVGTDFAAFGTAIKNVMSAMNDKELFDDEYVLADVIDAIFKDPVASKYQWLWPVPATVDLANWAYLEDNRTHLNEDVAQNLMKIFGFKIFPKSSGATPTIGDRTKAGLIGTVKSKAIVVDDRFIYPETVKIDEL